MHRKGNGSPACYLGRNASLIGDCIFHPDFHDKNVNASIMFVPHLKDVSDHVFSRQFYFLFYVERWGGVKWQAIPGTEFAFSSVSRSSDMHQSWYWSIFT